MGLPLFSAQDDPGPSFFHYAQSSGLSAPTRSGEGLSAHATTVVAVRYVGGVVMVGDRQATGSYIASRDVRKIERTSTPRWPSRAPPRGALSSFAWPSSPSSTTKK